MLWLGTKGVEKVKKKSVKARGLWRAHNLNEVDDSW